MNVIWREKKVPTLAMCRSNHMLKLFCTHSNHPKIDALNNIGNINSE